MPLVPGEVASDRVASDRKPRLFACACCRQVWHLLTDDRSRRAVEVTERFVDGEATEEEWAAARAAARSAAGHTDWDNYAPSSPSRALAAWQAAMAAGDAAWDAAWDAAGAAPWDAATKQQAPLLRDIVGNPFRPVTLAPAVLAWQGGTVGKLAEGIYEERAFDRLPILADALEDAGCTDRAILDHCRGPGPHARGCWVVDLVLGKQ
jgi:hypothetical protein